MSDTVKLIIKISEDVYTRLFDNGIQDNEIAVDDVCEMARALRIGTPLDDVKAEIAKPQEIDLGQFVSRSNAGILRFGIEAYFKGINHVVELLDNIGKAEKGGE